MRRSIIGISLAALAVALAVALTPAATARTMKTVPVSIKRTGFVPKNVGINFEDTVRWTNNDTINHRVSCAKCPFTSPVLKPGQSFTYRFTKAGKFNITDPLHRNIKGTVTVKAPPTGVTLLASKSVTIYRSSTKLTGSVSNQRAGEKVTILARECGETAFTPLKSVETTTDGNYSTRVRPAKRTAYEARWRSATSAAETVSVRPKIRLKKIAPRKFRVRVSAAQSYAGRRVLFQRFRPAAGKWRTVKRVKLKGITTLGSTEVSGKTFKAKVRRNALVRIKMKTRAARPCYLGGVSNKVKA